MKLVTILLIWFCLKAEALSVNKLGKDHDRSNQIQHRRQTEDIPRLPATYTESCYRALAACDDVPLDKYLVDQFFVDLRRIGVRKWCSQEEIFIQCQEQAEKECVYIEDSYSRAMLSERLVFEVFCQEYVDDVEANAGCLIHSDVYKDLIQCSRSKSLEKDPCNKEIINYCVDSATANSNECTQEGQHLWKKLVTRHQIIFYECPDS